MGYNKKVGIVLMITSPVVAIISLLSSDTDCNLNNENLHWLSLIIHECFRIRLFPEEVYVSHTAYSIDFSTKYILFLCIISVALGLLYYLEVFNAPRKRVSDQAKSTPNK